MRLFISITILILFLSCHNSSTEQISKPKPKQYLVVLGIAQDGGFPHIGCQRDCCTNYYERKVSKQKVVSLGLVDKKAKKKFLFEATPDMTTRLDDLERNHLKTNKIIEGIFVTHAHMGHYAGLLYFGREALGKKDIPVYTMPKMMSFLRYNGPWSQLINLKNIQFPDLKEDSTVVATKSLKITPFWFHIEMNFPKL